MNRMGLGLAVGAGYLLGRTRKLKLAVAVGSLAAGKKLNLGPRAVADLVNQQLKDNPQFKEIGDQLRQDLRGVGKAASGAMVERQMTTLADRLHGRTAQVRDQLAGAVPDTGGGKRRGGERAARERGSEDEHEEGYEAEYDDEYDDREGREADEEAEATGESGEADESGGPRRQRARKAPVKETAQKARARAPGRKPAKKAPARETGGKKPAAKERAAAGGASRSARSGNSKGGGDR
ncbi:MULTISPECIES: DNA primase [unclassified Streptomyces]|uniref:DNA primase n=1 Tax=unclassified Streptomyces TaxID=2593676 RepID=UPI002740E480|nr:MULTISPECIES: DNA primase [unclassified Streptomyces]